MAGLILCAASLWPPQSSELAKTGTEGSSAILATVLEVDGIGPVAGKDTVVGNTLAVETLALEASISAVTERVSSTI